MKKSLYLLAGVLFISIVGCQGQSDAKPEGQPESSIEKTGTAAKQVEATMAETNTARQAPLHITKADFLRLVMDYEKSPDKWAFKGDVPCVIDFYADWCAPCRITSPILEELSGEYAGRINIYKVDIEQERELASVFGVQSIPTFLFCPVTGSPTISSGIANTPEATKEMFRKQIEELLLKTGNDAAI